LEFRRFMFPKEILRDQIVQKSLMNIAIPGVALVKHILKKHLVQ
jgi:hypothetical protein